MEQIANTTNGHKRPNGCDASVDLTLEEFYQPTDTVMKSVEGLMRLNSLT